MVDLNHLRNLAAAVAAHADLEQVRLFSVEGTLDQIPDNSESFSYSLDTHIDVQQILESKSLIVDGIYTLSVFLADPSSNGYSQTQKDVEAADQANEPQEGRLAYLNFQLAALYSLPDYDGPEKYPDNELDAFGRTTGLLALHPYARELISSMTGRMGLPALHLPTARVPLDKRDNDDEDPNP